LLLRLFTKSIPRFVRSCLVKQDGELGVQDLYGHYQRDGVKLRHDLVSANKKAKRGWRGLALVGAGRWKRSKNVPWVHCLKLDAPKSLTIDPQEAFTGLSMVQPGRSGLRKLVTVVKLAIGVLAPLQANVKKLNVSVNSKPRQKGPM